MRLILSFCLVVLLPLAALADDWDALNSPTAIALMRHALAPGTGDPAAFDITDCSTQRNLDDRGRAQSVEIGRALRSRGIDFDAVWTSQWCRCRDTAELLDLGAVTEVPSLNSFFENRSAEPGQTEETRALLSAHEGGRLMLVTHQVNITALTGVVPSSGEIIVVERDGDDIKITGRILIRP